MSVGYGRRQRGRPLSPMEVGQLLRRALEQGASRSECAEKVGLDATGVGRFLRLSELPSDVQDWVDWGSGEDFIGFSCAAELVRLQDSDDQRIVGDAILSQRLSSKEVRQVSQLRRRSGRPTQQCVEEIVGMRPVVEKRYVFMGAVVDENTVATLGELAQSKRDALLSAGIAVIGLEGASGRLGARTFTLVGGEEFGRSMERVGKKSVERLVRENLQESIESGTSSS